MQSAAARPASDAECLHEIVQGAYALGKAASELALAAKEDLKAFCDLSAEFRHCFFAVRMGIRLGLTLRAGTGSAAPLPRPETEHERLEVERPDCDEAPTAAIRPNGTGNATANTSPSACPGS